MSKYEKLAEKWHKYCLNKKKYDSCEFQFLLYPETKLRRDQLLDIFKYYDCKEELTNRILFLYDFLNKENRININLQEIENLARKDMLAKTLICESYLGLDLSYLSKDKIINAKVRYVENSDDFHNAIKNPVNARKMLDEDTGEVIFGLMDKSDIVAHFGLHEALYGFLRDYSLIYYVLSLFSSEEMDFSNYVKLRQAGANYAMIGSELLIELKPWRKLEP